MLIIPRPPLFWRLTQLDQSRRAVAAARSAVARSAPNGLIHAARRQCQSAWPVASSRSTWRALSTSSRRQRADVFASQLESIPNAADLLSPSTAAADGPPQTVTEDCTEVLCRPCTGEEGQVGRLCDHRAATLHDVRIQQPLCDGAILRLTVMRRISLATTIPGPWRRSLWRQVLQRRIFQTT
jgi:hypothetical protein